MAALSDIISLEVLVLWGVAAGAAFIQTLTGFAFGLILMGAIGLFGLISLVEGAIVVSLLVIVNAVMVLRRDWRAIDRAGLSWLLTGSLPGLAIGYGLLLYLAESAIAALSLLLGAIIVLAALQMFIHPRTLDRRSQPASFLAAGLAGGIMGGLFSTSGPPVIWQMYRQPFDHVMVRSTLVSVFFLNALVRLGMVVATTGIPMRTWLAAAGAAPMVWVGTTLAQKFPPPIAPAVMRRFASVLLLLTGLALCLSPLMLLINEVLQ